MISTGDKFCLQNMFAPKNMSVQKTKPAADKARIPARCVCGSYHGHYSRQHQDLCVFAFDRR